MNKTGIIVLVAVLSFLLLVWSAPFFGYKFIGVNGNSMNPVITEEDVVVIATDFGELKPGDIICYKLRVEENEFLFLHRIIEINDTGIKTKGDNMPEPDPYLVKPSDIVGKEILVIPKLGILMRALKTIYGFVLLIIVPAALLIILEIKKIFNP